MAAPIIVAVGGVLIRTTAKALPKVLRRFKGAKQVKKPTESQVDKAQRITGNLGNFTKPAQKTLKAKDTARPGIKESLTGAGRTSGQKALQGVKTGETRRAKTVAVAIGTGTTALGTGIGFSTGKKSKEVEKETKKPSKKEKPMTLPKSKPKKPKSKVTPPKPKSKPKPKPKSKKKETGVVFVFETQKKGK